MSWQEGFLKVERIIPKAIGLFKRIFKKEIFPSERYLVLSPNKKEKPPRPKIKSWVNPKQNTCHKKNFIWEGEFFRRKNLNHLPQTK